MNTLDWIIIALYFGVVFFIAYFVTRRDRQQAQAGADSADYFLAGRNTGWFVIGASLFASNIGSEHLVGLAGSGANGDFAAGQFEVLAALILLLLGWVFVPYYIRSGVFTMPEFLERRYSSGARTYLSIISILAYVLTKISFTIFAGALVFEVILGIPFWTGALIVVVATGIYTIFGGLRAVIYTDMIQMFVLVLGAIAVTYFGLQAIGGWDVVYDTVMANSLPAGEVNAEGDNYRNAFNLWPAGNSSYPWTGILFGAPILGIWYWCTDQFIVQRVLSAKNLSNARKGTIFGGFLKLTPLFLFIIPGIIAYALSQTSMPDLFTVTNPINGEVTSDRDAALPAMIANVLPTGVRGLVVAGLLAALMSSLSSVFNSCSTLFTLDFYKRWKPTATERELVTVGRIATIVLVIIGLAWIPFMRALTEGEGVYKYLQSVQAYISPPIAAAFLLGIFYKRVNSKGAMAALWTGFVLGMFRLTIEYLSGTGQMELAAGSFLFNVANINFLHFAIILFVICSAIMVGVSLITRRETFDLSAAGTTAVPVGAIPTSTARSSDATVLDSQDVATTVDPAQTPAHLADSAADRRQDAILAVLLVIAVLVLWAVFSPVGVG